MERPKPADLIALVIANANALRGVGVLKLSLDGCSIELAPSDPGPMPKVRDDEDVYPDPLNDPATYADGQIPGFDLSGLDVDPDGEPS